MIMQMGIKQYRIKNTAVRNVRNYRLLDLILDSDIMNFQLEF